MKDFYEELESGVRKWVKVLRDAGINTMSSCHHEGSIRCQCFYPEIEVDRIQYALNEAGAQEYCIIVTYSKHGDCYEKWIDVKSREFKYRE